MRGERDIGERDRHNKPGHLYEGAEYKGELTREPNKTQHKMKY
jgi:hypothetical protein